MAAEERRTAELEQKLRATHEALKRSTAELNERQAEVEAKVRVI